jgi:predicted NAD-dependent protein-ADP-ribosyltransferase YbiA (DUF1768 family)
MEHSDTNIKRIVVERMERCGICHRTFATDDVHVVSRSPELWMMVVACKECHDRKLVAAVLDSGDPDQAAIALRRLQSRPDRAEWSRSKPLPPVTVDDVLDMHEFLSDFDGDFQRLFRPSR